jgi:DNA adenine methylase
VRMCSPLRYPGGKSCLFEFTSNLLSHNHLNHGHYAEPFAGGCGLALALLYAGQVAEISINDVDPSIWAFWDSVLNRTGDLISLIEETPVSIEEWHRQREIHRDSDVSDSLALGFSAFFLNRTNRSGIIKGGGVIGGLDQTGNYKIDCRYNVDDLSKRIKRVSRYKSQIHLTNLDAQDFLDSCRSLPSRSLLFIDPPYFKKGPGLYTSYYKERDHSALADRISLIETPWVVTYDNTQEIRQLYTSHRQYSFDLHYSLNQKRIGEELLVVSQTLKLPPDSERTQLDRRPKAIAA